MSLETSRLRFTGVNVVNGAYELQTERQVMLDNILFVPGISAIPEATAEDSLGNPLTPIDYTDGEGRNWRAFEFLTSGELIVTRSGRVEYLIVAGGAGGGSRFQAGGGGGAGGSLHGSKYVNIGVNAITVGAGGAGAPDTVALSGSDGSPTTAFGMTAIGGGGGGAALPTIANSTGRNGGCGGGGGGNSIMPGNAPGGIGSQGFNGGLSIVNTGGVGHQGGGGGGAVSAGANAVLSVQNTPGGAGVVSAISGTSKTYAAGGVGSQSPVSLNGAANSGNGGGGAAGSPSAGGNGGSGVVVVRFRR